MRGLEHQGFDEIIGVVYVNFRGIDGSWPNMFLPQDGSLIAVSERRGATLLYRGTAPWTHLQPLDSRGHHLSITKVDQAIVEAPIITTLNDVMEMLRSASGLEHILAEDGEADDGTQMRQRRS